MAEFKGKTLAHLEIITRDIGSINGEMKEVKTDLAEKACKKDIRILSQRVDNLKLVSAVTGAVGGIVSGIAAFLGLRTIKT